MKYAPATSITKVSGLVTKFIPSHKQSPNVSTALTKAGLYETTAGQNQS